MKDVDVDNLDWSQLNVDASTLNLAPPRPRGVQRRSRRRRGVVFQRQGQRRSAVTVKQSIFPFWIRGSAPT